MQTSRLYQFILIDIINVIAACFVQNNIGNEFSVRLINNSVHCITFDAYITSQYDSYLECTNSEFNKYCNV